MKRLHRAYAFAHSDFRAELAPCLEAALSTNDGAALERFIDEHRDALTDPYEGEPLAEDWRDLLEEGDVHELGDFALTKYYDGDLDLGLDADFVSVRDALEQAGVDPKLLLGEPLGEGPAPFDPSRQGSYFQSEAQVQRALAVVEGVVTARPERGDVLAPLLGLLMEATRRGRGLYVTF